SLQSLFAQTLSKIVCKFANGSACLIGICGMVKAHTRILTERGCIRYYKAGILAACHMIHPPPKLTQAAVQSFLCQRCYLCERGNAKISEMSDQFSYCY